MVYDHHVAVIIVLPRIVDAELYLVHAYAFSILQ